MKAKEEPKPIKPVVPEISPKPKERPVTKPEKPDVIPPDVKPGKGNPEIGPVKT